MSPIPKNWSPRMITMEWISQRETAPTMARAVLDLLRGAQVRWEGLPGWKTCFHVAARGAGPLDARVTLLLWPEPDAD